MSNVVLVSGADVVLVGALLSEPSSLDIGGAVDNMEARLASNGTDDTAEAASADTGAATRATSSNSAADAAADDEKRK